MRCGRSERAGDLKAGNITLPLDWTTTSRLTLPRSTGGLGLVWYVLQLFDLLLCLGKQESGFASGASLLDGTKVDLQLFELDAGVSELAVEIAVAMDLAGKPPIIVVNEGIMEQSEID